MMKVAQADCRFVGEMKYQEPADGWVLAGSAIGLHHRSVKHSVETLFRARCLLLVSAAAQSLTA
jgi:hypothetical protein